MWKKNVEKHGNTLKRRETTRNKWKKHEKNTEKHGNTWKKIWKQMEFDIDIDMDGDMIGTCPLCSMVLEYLPKKLTIFG